MIKARAIPIAGPATDRESGNEPMTVINLHIPVDLLRRVTKAAERQGRAAWIRQAIEEKLKEETHG